jgi:PAP2 superfamily
MRSPGRLARWVEMAFGWGFVGLCYHLAAAWPARPATLVWETAIDRAIPFAPEGIWVYLSFFILVPCAYVFCDRGRLRWLRWSMQSCAVVCAAVYVCWPTTLVYPAITGDSVSAHLLRRLTDVDAATNCLPSLHGALSLLSIWALLPTRGGLSIRTIGLWAWGLFIACAVIQTRRHLALDLAAGVALGGGCGMAVQGLQRRLPSLHLRRRTGF